MQPPSTNDGSAQRERRLSDKLDRSPGSFFKARARDLVLAADYANSRLPENAYGATSRRHHHTVCGATYAVLLSSFELAFKALYARIIDNTQRYDDRLQRDTSMSVEPELILANRGVTGAGEVFANRWTAWQNPTDVNKRFRSLVEIDPIPNAAVSDLEQFWQIRHILAHSSGVTSQLDRHRLGGAIEADRALLIDGEYLGLVETRLLEVLQSAVDEVGRRLLDDFFEQQPNWEANQIEFSSLHLLGQVVGQTQDLPEVDVDRFEAEEAERVAMAQN